MLRIAAVASLVCSVAGVILAGLYVADLDFGRRCCVSCAVDIGVPML